MRRACGCATGTKDGMSDSALTTRTLSEAELRDFVPVIWHAFYGDVRPDDLKQQVALLDPARTHAVFDGETIIGGGSMLARAMTLPGTGPVPIAAVTAVGVTPDQRRRGALSTLMRAELHGLHESGGEPVAALWASEGGIYGRYGYGLASRRASMRVARGAAFRSDVDLGTERVRLVDADTAGATLRKLHPQYAGTRIGGVSRPEAAWEWKLSDPERDRDGASALRFAVLPDGYARFRVKENWDGRHGPEHEVRVNELVSLTPQAHAALWHFLTSLDLVGEVRYHNAPLDDPLPWMLDNPRIARLDVGDALYVRLVDVDRALQARGYAAPLDMVLEVSDEFCPWNTGRWHLSVDSLGRASVRRTDAEADLACGATALGAAFLGSTRLSTLAAAGRVHELRPGALRAASAAFAAEHEPHCLDVF
jgi:predicted acetyltransferase